MAGRLRAPPEKRHRVTPRVRVDELVECLEKAGLLFDQLLVAAADSPLTPRRLDPLGHLALGLDDGVTAHAGGLGNEALPTAAQHLGERSCHDTALQLVQVREDDLEESRGFVPTDLHPLIVLRAY